MTHPYSPATLAKRWECSPETVRNLIRKGELKAFRIGTKIKIPYGEVERIESCGTMTEESHAPVEALEI